MKRSERAMPVDGQWTVALGLCGVVLALTTGAAHAQTAEWAKPIESANIRLVGHTDLNGHGNGGEGLALTQYPDRRRVLFLAHESSPVCFSAVDVSDRSRPRVLAQVPTVSPDVRCNSLGLSGTTLIVAHQTARIGLPNAGVRIYDVANPAAPRELSFFDTSGPHSRGVHFVSFVDGQYAYLATGAKDFTPTHPNDDQFLMIVDVRNPRRPQETGRWWLPGTRTGDDTPPPPRLKIDSGYRMHTLVIDPQRPTRAYVAWIDGGVVILNIGDKSRPTLVGRTAWYPPDTGFLHTALPILSRRLLVASEEANQNACADWPKRIALVDISDETKPRRTAIFPSPTNFDELCKRGGRFGAHNIHVNRPSPYSRTLARTVVGSFFNGGVRVYSIENPGHPEEIGSFVPAPPPGNTMGAIQINDVYVDEKGFIYANDRVTGGLYILEYTGSLPLN
jgi:hypothetical protein